MLAGLHDRGFTDLVAAHVDVWRYPGPENQRPSELATQTRMTKQALNYLLGQLEQLGYLTRETDSNDQRSKRIRLTPRGHAATKAIYEIVQEVEDRMGTTTGTPKVRPATPPTHAALHDRHADQRPGLEGKRSARAASPQRALLLQDARRRIRSVSRLLRQNPRTSRRPRAYESRAPGSIRSAPHRSARNRWLLRTPDTPTAH